MASFLLLFFDLLLRVISWAILIRVLLSWIPNLDPYHPIVRLLYQITDPILEPARRLIPPVGGIDISPIVVFLAIDFLLRPLVRAIILSIA